MNLLLIGNLCQGKNANFFAISNYQSNLCLTLLSQFVIYGVKEVQEFTNQYRNGKSFFFLFFS